MRLERGEQGTFFFLEKKKLEYAMERKGNFVSKIEITVVVHESNHLQILYELWMSQRGTQIDKMSLWSFSS